jgi:hypothetical protein
MPDLGSSGAGGHRRGPAWSRRDGAAWRACPARNADPVCFTGCATLLRHRLWSVRGIASRNRLSR